jgi:hypothetical protein
MERGPHPHTTALDIKYGVLDTKRRRPTPSCTTKTFISLYKTGRKQLLLQKSEESEEVFETGSFGLGIVKNLHISFRRTLLGLRETKNSF